jgi:hypothetical protein
VVVLLEGALCVGYGGFLAFETLVAPAADRMAAAIMAITSLVLGGALVLAARAVGRARRAVRAPIVVWQLMQLAVARLTADTAWAPFGIALAILSVGAVVAAFLPGVLEEPSIESIEG